MANAEHLKILKQGFWAWDEWRHKNPDIEPDLSGANLKRMALPNEFPGSDNILAGADLSGVNFSKADLRGVDLRGARLVATDFGGANLWRSSLCGAYLHDASLGNANLSEIELGWATFSNVDLSEVIGLDRVSHAGPSTVGIDTLFRSKGRIPEVFLRGAGVPEDFICYIRSLTARTIDFYSCFISYSSKDQMFANRLHADLQSKGVRCWFAPEDLRIGDRIRVRIDESIRLYDKLLLVLSENSIASEWVEKEFEAAMEKERQQKSPVLFPICLDDEIMRVPSGWAADIRRSRNIGDFRNWQSLDDYQISIDKLLRDLKGNL